MSYKYSYPEYYYSDKVRDLLFSEPSLPLEPTPPIEPQKPVNPGNYDSGGNRGCFLVFFIGAIIAFIAVMTSDIENKGSMIIPGIIVILCSFFSLKTERWDKEAHEKKQYDYSKALQDFPRLQAQYQKEYEDYVKLKEAYDRRVQFLLSKPNVLCFKRSIIQKWVSTRSAPKFQPCELDDLIRIGVSEHYFAEELKLNGFDIAVNQRIPVGSKYYYPDILIICDNLYIDIEIDEPYSGNDGTPIHYLEEKYGIKESIDSARNDYLTKKGFEVIRFSEEQIFMHTQDCIDFIVSFISSIKNGDERIDCPDDFKLKKWTKDQASKLAYQRFRNTYVPVDLQKSITAEIYSSYAQIRSEVID